ncbi:unnamed protein product [Amoebophrya sp. A120]|nr:unnamed protein product [Amoebophrya sp. A120]|eukprot:GSA120T00023175001.1
MVGEGEWAEGGEEGGKSDKLDVPGVDHHAGGGVVNNKNTGTGTSSSNASSSSSDNELDELAPDMPKQWRTFVQRATKDVELSEDNISDEDARAVIAQEKADRLRAKKRKKGIETPPPEEAAAEQPVAPVDDQSTLQQINVGAGPPTLKPLQLPIGTPSNVGNLVAPLVSGVRAATNLPGAAVTSGGQQLHQHGGGMIPPLLPTSNLLPFGTATLMPNLAGTMQMGGSTSSSSTKGSGFNIPNGNMPNNMVLPGGSGAATQVQMAAQQKSLMDQIAAQQSQLLKQLMGNKQGGGAGPPGITAVGGTDGSVSKPSYWWCGNCNYIVYHTIHPDHWHGTHCSKCQTPREEVEAMIPPQRRETAERNLWQEWKTPHRTFRNPPWLRKYVPPGSAGSTSSQQGVSNTSAGAPPMNPNMFTSQQNRNYDLAQFNSNTGNMNINPSSGGSFHSVGDRAGAIGKHFGGPTSQQAAMNNFQQQQPNQYDSNNVVPTSQRNPNAGAPFSQQHLPYDTNTSAALDAGHRLSQDHFQDISPIPPPPPEEGDDGDNHELSQDMEISEAVVEKKPDEEPDRALPIDPDLPEECQMSYWLKKGDLALPQEQDTLQEVIEKNDNRDVQLLFKSASPKAGAMPKSAAGPLSYSATSRDSYVPPPPPPPPVEENNSTGAEMFDPSAPPAVSSSENKMENKEALFPKSAGMKPSSASTSNFPHEDDLRRRGQTNNRMPQKLPPGTRGGPPSRRAEHSRDRKKHSRGPRRDHSRGAGRRAVVPPAARNNSDRGSSYYERGPFDSDRPGVRRDKNRDNFYDRGEAVHPAGRNQQRGRDHQYDRERRRGTSASDASRGRDRGHAPDARRDRDRTRTPQLEMTNPSNYGTKPQKPRDYNTTMSCLPDRSDRHQVEAEFKKHIQRRFHADSRKRQQEQRTEAWGENKARRILAVTRDRFYGVANSSSAGKVKSDVEDDLELERKNLGARYRGPIEDYLSPGNADGNKNNEPSSSSSGTPAIGKLQELKNMKEAREKIKEAMMLKAKKRSREEMEEDEEDRHPSLPKRRSGGSKNSSRKSKKSKSPAGRSSKKASKKSKHEVDEDHVNSHEGPPGEPSDQEQLHGSKDHRGKKKKKSKIENSRDSNDNKMIDENEDNITAAKKMKKKLKKEKKQRKLQNCANDFSLQEDENHGPRSGSSSSSSFHVQAEQLTPRSSSSHHDVGSFRPVAAKNTSGQFAIPPAPPLVIAGSGSSVHQQQQPMLQPRKDADFRPPVPPAGFSTMRTNGATTYGNLELKPNPMYSFDHEQQQPGSSSGRNGALQGSSFQKAALVSREEVLQREQQQQSTVLVKEARSKAPVLLPPPKDVLSSSESEKEGKPDIQKETEVARQAVDYEDL